MAALHARVQEAFAKELDEQTRAAEGVICLDANVVRLPVRDALSILKGVSAGSESGEAGACA